MEELTKETAGRFLAHVPEQNKFWCTNGEVFATLEQFEVALKKMDQTTFKAHANAEKNDFSNWIYDIVGDTTLANELRRCKVKKDAEKKVKFRVANLKKVATK